jgi:hypothetical protein
MPNTRVRAVRRESDRFKRLKSLRCFPEVHKRILEGWPSTQVARFIQDDQQEGGDLTRGALIAMVNDYRQSIPRAELISTRLSPVFNKAAEEVRHGLDELEELEHLYRLQMERIGIDFNIEKNVGKLMSSMTNEVKAAKDILATYAELKMDLGLTQRHIGQVEIDAKVIADVAGHYGSPAVGEVLSDPESRRKVLALAQQLLTAGDEAEGVLDVTEGAGVHVDASGEPAEEGEEPSEVAG